ncbi:PEP/pyruvate-binding domain-containing protein [Kribbella sp. NPDC048928]|uniref:PEP/pyruvate-binding domain-containing protein n=1 Tax=Kribbella sp. NPDC048928 TaxID=3364111 RepID=UPI0037200B7D
MAVRSSASNEDTAAASGAGQHDSFLGVQGIDAVLDAVRACRESLWSARATSYRGDVPTPQMAVIIQCHIDADVSGVMFTELNGPTLIESSWGLGPTVVEGRITPDQYEVTTTVTRTIADKPTALHRAGAHLETCAVPEAQRRTPTLTDATAQRLATLGHRAAAVFESPQDIEWAIADDTIWLLQARPITAHLPTNPRGHEPTGAPAHAPTSPAYAGPTGPSTAAASRAVLLTGIPGSHGTATGPARIVRGPADFAYVRPGDILVCPHTDPAWTPLLSIAAGVITESGGLLSHAAIVAREQGIPAVLAVPEATTQLTDNTPTTINGSKGTVNT